MRLPLAVPVLVFMTFVMGTSEFMVMGILPDISAGLGVDYMMVAGLISVFALSYAVFTPVVSGIVGRFERYRIFMVCAVLFVVANIWTMAAWDYASMALSRILTAAVSGVLFSVQLTFVVDMADVHVRAMSIGWIFAGFNISAIVGVPFGAMISHAFGWRSAFMAIAIMGVIAVAVCALTLPRNNPLVKSESKGGVGTMLRDPRMIGCFCITLLVFAGTYTVYTYLNPILTEGIGFDESNVGVGIMLFGVMCLLSNLTAGKIAGSGGMRYARWILLAHAVVLAVLPFALGASVTGMVVMMLVGLMMYLTNSSIQMEMMDIAATDYPKAVTFASSLNPTAFSLGIAAGSFLSGVIYDASGISDLGFVAALLILAASAVTFAVHSRRPGCAAS